MRDKPCILPSVTLAIIVSTVCGSERAVFLAEHAIAVLSSDEAKFMVKECCVRLAAVEEILIILFLSEHLGRIGDGSICQCILEVICYRFVELVIWDVSVLHPRVLSSVRPQGRLLHCFESQFIVKAFKAFDYGVSHRRDARIADHAVCLAAVQMPYRKLALLLIDGEHRVDEFGIALSLEDAVERHGCPVSVPE